ncbi:MAG TPA: FAD-binding oxidoreductase, partial [Candidatus Dormibacteraeota bacterium]|nr:FAD-binding oxidoreductase [Candidatus Dormibacteraeota bacterium]
MTAAHASLLDALRAALGSSNVLTDADLRAGYETDWTRRWHGEAVAVVRPETTDAVVAALAACREAGVAVIPQGGNTGLVGGSVPRAAGARPQVVLSLTRLRDLEPVDTAAAEVTVGAGVTLGNLEAHVRAVGYAFGVDLGARDSATIGGMIATNAGGIHAFRHGPMRWQLVGVEAVLADGTVVRRLPGLLKDNTGYHLPSLLAGSEGTLAVVTRARVRLVPHLARRAVALLAAAGPDEAADLAGELRRRLPNLLAAELFFDDGMALVLHHAGGQRPFSESHPAYLLVEVDDEADPTPELAAAVEAAGPAVRDAVLATDEAARQRLWRLRERHTESVNAEGIPHKLDVAVPIGRLGAYARDVRQAIAAVAPNARTFLYGHVLDGNLHVNVLGP